MTFWQFLDSLPWWLMLLSGIFAGSVAMYAPAYKKGQIEVRLPPKRVRWQRRGGCLSTCTICHPAVLVIEPLPSDWGFWTAAFQAAKRRVAALPDLPLQERAMTTDWKPGDPCGHCGSTNTGEDAERGGYCNGCGACDADDE